ncbi:MAG TPA: EAL domain-containing protein [Treponemataceae bacterium]|nr:EAL domain-containing protein [Treponemataceae bacterium]
MSNERVYIVEDERVVAIDLKRRLERLGYSVCGSASNGQDALSEIARLRPDIILMDVLLRGDLDGIEVALTVKKELDIPVIFLSAYTDHTTIERAKEATPVGFILKPFKERELATMLEMALFKSVADLKVREKEQLFAAILNSTTDAILVVGKNGNIVFMNPEAEQLLEISDTEARHLQAYDLFTLANKETGEEYRIPRFNDHNKVLKAQNLRLTNRSNKSFVVDMIINHEVSENTTGGDRIISFKDISRLDEITDTLNYQASHDTLTGLLNRNELAARLNEILRKSAGQQSSIHALFIDIDHFKILNDSCGTHAGDVLIRTVAASLKRHVHGRNFAARIGADDFVLVHYSLDESGDPTDVTELARVLLDSCTEDVFTWKGKPYPYTLSIGIIPINETFDSEHEIMIAGTQTVLKVHRSGGNRFSFYEQHTGGRYQSLPISEWISRIHSALQEDGFVLYYQPIEPLLGGKERSKLEILLRMKDGDNPVIQPGEFIPIAERYNIISSIDRWVIDKAFSTYARLAKKHHPLAESVFSINLSGGTLVDENIVSFILNKATEYAIPPGMFCIELTESSAILNLASASSLITGLKEKGFSFALDDFGSGFSSFSYLKNLPVDFVKIDGSFIRNMDRDPVDYTMVQAVSSMSRILGLKTIGEFAENDTIIRMLGEIGVDYAQGYGIARPKPFED